MLACLDAEVEGRNMKCFVHQAEDAVAICKTCGKGVCSDCAIILEGTSYCKTCVEAGRTGSGRRCPEPGQ